MKLRSRTTVRSRPRSRGDGVHHALHDEAALGAPGTAVGRDDDGVRVERAELDPVDARVVGPEQLGAGDDRDDQAVGDVGPVVVPELHRQPAQPAVVVVPDPDVVQLPALVGAGHEVLAPVLGPLHRLPEPLGRPRHEHLLRPGVHDLDAETAADVGRHHLDPVDRQGQLRGDRLPHARRRLGGGVHQEGPVVGVPAGQHALALQGHRRAALDGEVELERVRRALDRGLGVTGLLHHHGGDVVRHVLVDEQLRGAGGLDPDHGAGHSPGGLAGSGS